MNLSTNYVSVTHVTAETLTKRLHKVKKSIDTIEVDGNGPSLANQIVDTIASLHKSGLRGLFDGQRKHIKGKDEQGRPFILTFHGERDETYRYELILVDAFDLKKPEESRTRTLHLQGIGKVLADSLGSRSFDFSGEQAETHWRALTSALNAAVAQDPDNARNIVEQGLKDVGLEAHAERTIEYYDDLAPSIALLGQGPIVDSTVLCAKYLYEQSTTTAPLESSDNAKRILAEFDAEFGKAPVEEPMAKHQPEPEVITPITQETTMNQVTLTKAPRCDVIIPEVTEMVLVNLEPFGLSEHKELVETYYRAALQAPTQEQARMEIDALCSEFMDIGYENIDPFRFESYTMLQAVGKVFGEKPANHPDTTHEAAVVNDRAIEGRTDILDFFDMRKGLFAEKHWKYKKHLNKDDHHNRPAAHVEAFPVLDLSKEEQRVALLHAYADVPFTPEEGKRFEQAACYAGSDDAGNDYYLENMFSHVHLVVRWTGGRIPDLTLTRKAA